MRINQVGNKVDTVIVSCKSYETTKIIRRGMGICWLGQLDPIYVVIPNTMGGNAPVYLAGIATTDIMPKQSGEMIVYGPCNFIAFPGSTRASSNVPFPPFVGGAPIGGYALIPDYATNGMIKGASPLTGPTCGVMAFGNLPDWPQIPVKQDYPELQSYIPVSGFVRLL